MVFLLVYFQLQQSVPNYARKGIFHGDDVIEDVTGWPPNWPCTFLYEWNKNIFTITEKQTNISLVNLMYTCILRLWPYLYKFVFMTSLIQYWTAISPLIFQLYHRSNTQNVGSGYGYLAGIFGSRYRFRLKFFFATSKWQLFENVKI